MARRVVRLSTTFRRSLDAVGAKRPSAAYRAATATIDALENAEILPGAGDYETKFSIGRAHVRRVSRHNVWLLYRFDDDHVYVMTARGEPPVPVDG